MKKLIVSFVASVLFLVGCSNGSNTSSDIASTSSTQETISEFNLDDYKASISECRTAINDASIYLANMGKYKINYWKALGELSDTIADNAFEWLSEKSDETKESVTSAYGEIREQYKNIILIEIEGKEAEEIDSSFRNMYDAYTSMYSLVTAPSGTLTDFSEKLSECVSSITDSEKDLALFLD